MSILLYTMLDLVTALYMMLQAMANANNGGGIVATDHTSSDFVSMEEHCGDMNLLRVGNDQRHPLSLDHPLKEEQIEEEEDLEGSVVALSCEDTKRLIYLETNNNCNNSDGSGERELGQTELLYKTSSKLCQSKSSILVCRGLTLLVCLALLLGGILIAVTIRHHPVGCDQEEGLTSASLNCSFVCYQSPANTMELLATPT